MTRTDEVWKKAEVSRNFIEGVRGAIPLASEQIEIMLRIIQQAQPQVENFLDLGCGDGILGRAIHTQYPAAKGVFLDFSETMIQSAQSQDYPCPENLNFLTEDFSNSAWINAIKNQTPFDIIVSGFSIHHQPDTRKKELYQEIYYLLKPGGLFLNLEHVASPNQWVEKLFDELFIDALYAFHKSQGTNKTRKEIDQQYYNRDDKTANILAPVQLQCDWLRELGFINVDCFFKVFEIALFGGMRPDQ
ncbi:methyltransferase type 12 [Oscillatoriales cyanobacterium USR001]|nr:methyltransferase type 12 [Oscillatoriales cyanobacterium USR001]